jgi:hypothetical protein
VEALLQAGFAADQAEQAVTAGTSNSGTTGAGVTSHVVLGDEVAGSPPARS